MPKRILTYLNNMDILRDETDEKVDELLKKINVKSLVNNPESMKIIVLKFINENKHLFKQARTEGQKLARSLDVKS